jgi:NSS family neurotransmitter:Na+ symporter
LIAQLELPTRIIVDRGVKRSNAILIVIGVSFVFGVPSAINLNILSNQDFVWGMALLISGAVFAFMMVKHGISKIRKEEILQDPDDWNIGIWWEYIYKYFIPTASILLLTWWFVLAADDDQWYNPFNISSIANCIMQWVIIIGTLLILNKWIGKKSNKT